MDWKKGDECRVRRTVRGHREGEWIDGVISKVNLKTVWVRFKTTPLFDNDTKDVKVAVSEVRLI